MNLLRELREDYSVFVNLATTPAKAFAALTKDIDKWWGKTDQAALETGDIFTVSWGEPWYQFQLIEVIPKEKLVWECIDANQIIGDLEGVQKEWVGTKILWTISVAGDGEVRIDLMHKGLVPAFICYDVCSRTWGSYVTEHLKNYLEKLA